jgi:uncharacterized protein YdeI (BOF family)
MKYGILFFLISWTALAQTGIGTTTPNASAKLDVYSTNKGFLPPRVTLTSVSDVSTIASPAEGLLVYNLGSVGLQAGYYYWNGANWATIATATSAGNGVTSSDMVKLYGEAYSTTTGKIANVNGYSFTVPVSGRYQFDFTSTGYANSADFTMTFKVRQGTTDIGTDAQTSASNTVHVEYNGKVEVNLLSGTTYNVLVTSTGLRNSSDYDRVYYKQVAGNLPVTGQSVDYGIARYTGTDTGAMAAGALIGFDATAAGNLAWSGNKFTLKANKTYELESSLAIYQGGGGVAGRFQIYDYTNSVALASGLFMSQNGAGTNNPSANSPMKGIFTPTTDIQVGIRLLDFYGPGGPGIIGSTTTVGSQSSPNASYFMVKQIGSSAFVNPWILSGNDVYNTTGKVGIGNTSPNAKLDVRTSPTSTTDPGAGYIGIGTTSVAASTAGVGALRYNTANSLIEFSNGSTWLSLSPGNSPMYAQFSSNAGQYFNAVGTKMLFQVTNINVGSMSNASNGTIYLPAGRIYRVDLNLGWANVGWSRFAIFNTSNGAQISQTAHIEGGSGNWAGTGTTTCFINTSAGAINIEARFVAPVNSNSLFGDTANGGNYPTLTVQTVD